MEDDNKRDAVISGFHVAKILSAKAQEIIDVSLDLGMSQGQVRSNGSAITFPNGSAIAITLLEKILKKRSENDCFVVRDGEVEWMYIFGGNNSVYRLYEPRLDWPPTLSIDGSYMHAIFKSTPLAEAELKVGALGDVRGKKVLDTCFGLGYTAQVLAARGAKSIVSCEKSEDTLEIAKSNPWSARALSDSRVSVRNEDAADFLSGAKDGEFDLILHDPPTLKKGGDLYSGAFYRLMCAKLAEGGRLYHYIGTKDERQRKDYHSGAARRLKDAGFADVAESYRGLAALKEKTDAY
ncbi:Polyamine aminopropyltransferase [uncultured archaeon]|nr:Polyamine aminopropyltransferase [uncultured archaeon]